MFSKFFLEGCVAVFGLTMKEAYGQPQEARATFNDGGVYGSVVIADGKMSIVLEVDDFSEIPQGKSCFDGGIFYHIHESWYDPSDKNMFGPLCGASFTGGHWDPWLGCGSATGNDYCQVQGGCAFGSPVLGDTHDGTYECSSLSQSNIYTCEVGDLSSIFGALDFEDADFGLDGGITATQFFLPPASYLKDRSVVFHCNDGTRAFCAPFKLYDETNRPAVAKVKQNGDSMVAVFEDLDNSYIKLENDGTTTINIDLSSLSMPHNCGKKLNYRIYNDWTSSKKSEMYGNCDSNCVGSFYDPTGSCAYGSDHINCFDGKLCSDPYYEYNCDWNDVSSRYSCAPGDLSGKFGGLYIGDGDKSFLFSNHDSLMIQLNQLTDKSVALECSNSNEIVACAQFEKVSKVTTSSPDSKSSSESSSNSGSKSNSKSSSQSGSTSGSKSGSKSNSESSSSGKKVSSSGKKGSSSDKWTTQYGTWSASSGKKTHSGSGSSDKQTSSSEKKTGSSGSSGSSGSNKWFTNPGTWDVSSSSGKKISSSNSGGSSNSGDSSGSGSKKDSKSSSSPSASSSSNENDCGYGDVGEECNYDNNNNKIATWDISEASECNELFTMDGSIAGQVCVSKVDYDNIKLTYTTNDGYYLSQVNAWFGCDKNAYPKNDDYCPKLKHFPLQNNYLEDDNDYLSSYSFVTSISNCYSCENVKYCDYCDTYNELLFYVIAQAKLKHYDSYDNYDYKIAYMDGEFICQNDYPFATRHALSFDVQCC